MTTDPVVVVGAGQAGGELVAALRAAGSRTPIVLIGAESTHPYHRPALSKAYLLGEANAADLALRDTSMYEREGIQVMLGESVRRIDRSAHSVTLESGAQISYSTLVLATGGRPRRLQVAELESARNLHYLRTIDDVEGLRWALRPGARLAVVGGGYIGLEIASVARQRGVEVTVIEAQSRVLARVTSEPMSRYFTRLHREHGVDVRVDASIHRYELTSDGDVAAIALADGSTVSADAVLVGIGLVPNTELAESAGLEIDNGVVVDERLRTSDPDIYAIGDIARHPDSVHGSRRLESAPNASAQARALAQTLTGGGEAYRELPWFWSDQYDVKLQSAGLMMNHDRLIFHEDTEHSRRVAALYLRGNRLQAADVVANPTAFALVKRLINDEIELDTDALAEALVTTTLVEALKRALNPLTELMTATARKGEYK